MIGSYGGTRYPDIVRRLTGVEEPDVVPPGLILANDRPEWAHLRDEALAWSSQIVTAVAAQFSRIAVVNPAGTNVLFCGLKISCGGVGASNIVEIRLDPTVAVANPVRLNAADSRRPGWTAAGGAGQITINSDTNASSASASGPIWRVMFDAASQTRDSGIGPFVLTPGHALFLTVNAVNVGLVASFYGYTRFARPEELGPD